jgi:hypothetical protein
MVCLLLVLPPSPRKLPSSPAKFPDAGADAFISARYGPAGHPYEGNYTRELHVKLKIIVNVKAGQHFCKMTMHCLYNVMVMVIIGCEEYGALTKNGYCTHNDVLTYV